MLGVILLSGGLDSSVALWWAKKRGGYDELHTLTFLYGSREERIVRQVCEKISSLAGVKKTIFIDLPWLRTFSQMSGSALIEGKSALPEPKMYDLKNVRKLRETARSVWIPARNLCFIAVASAYAETLGGEVDIITGFNREEAETFPDNSLAFVEKMNAVLAMSTLKARVNLKAPLISMGKKEICLLAGDLNVPVEFSNSCYNPKGLTDDGKPVHCGTCESCVRRKRAFLESIGSDPTIYSSSTV
ncbi:MAG: 7-cyano-7-deazaguanine synthase QueC [Candidatus Freyarchaeota archaeon]|nr:7-cyano-7-deazaguanine synthase QueC [Candidatus Freyrarchaeum guaymaensis]